MIVTHRSQGIVAGLAAVLCVILGASPVIGQEVAGAAIEAEEAAQAGDAAAAWAAFDRATELFWASAPLTFRTAILAGNVDGAGRYRSAPTSYRAGDVLTAYFEPVGYGWTPVGDRFRIRFSVDFSIRNAAGVVLSSAEGFLALEEFAERRSREFAATLSLTLPGLPEGVYQLNLAFRDAATAKVATATFSFAMTP